MNPRREIQSIYESYMHIYESDGTTPPDGTLHEITPKEFAAIDLKLTQARTLMYRKYPFYYAILATCKTAITTDFDTMAVDENVNIYINPSFLITGLS